jgi:hypothetical protein
MHTQLRALLLVGLTAASCTTGDDPAAGSIPDAATAPPADAGVAAFREGLQYSGAVAFERSRSAGKRAVPAGASALVEHVEISAPILPDVAVLYAEEGAQFPATQAGEDSLADGAALVFDRLLVECAGYADYSGVVIAAPSDPPLTAAQLLMNYELVAQCSYVHHSAKPYWIPRLVADVDVCGRTLGTDWQMLSVSDLATFTAADFQVLADALAGGSSSGNFGAMYFSLRAYARDASGGLVQAHLEPGAAVRTEPLPVAATSTSHLEGDFGLRCIRSVP